MRGRVAFDPICSKSCLHSLPQKCLLLAGSSPDSHGLQMLLFLRYAHPGATSCHRGSSGMGEASGPQFPMGGCCTCGLGLSPTKPASWYGSRRQRHQLWLFELLLSLHIQDILNKQTNITQASEAPCLRKDTVIIS